MTQCVSRIKHAAGPHRSYSAADIAKLYGYPTISTQTQFVAIISLGGGYSMADVQAYCQKFGFPVPTIKDVSVDGATNNFTGNAQSADGENALDIQTVIGATAGRVGIIVYFCRNTGRSFANGVHQVAIDNIACVGTISWGAGEDRWSSSDQSLVNAALQVCQNAGIPFFAASGDNGSSDGESGNVTDFPSASPYCFGCGGTTMDPAGEVAWSYGGGGFSKLYQRPNWQPIAGVSRGVPDVAGNADPSTGYQIVVGGKWIVVGGTSAVSPMWAAGIALAVSITGKRFTSLETDLYAGLLTDITMGSNGAYQATTGWDPCTGEGTPNAAFWQALVGGQPSDPTQPPNPPTNPPAGQVDWAGLVAIQGTFNAWVSANVPAPDSWPTAA
jgi:kumamolisin